MARKLLIVGATWTVGCAPIGADRVTELEHALTLERSPWFSADAPGPLEGEATAVLGLGDALLACTEEGMSITWQEDEVTVGEEWRESEASANSELGVSCNNLDWWGERVAVSADDRVRIYTYYKPGDEPEWWDAYGFTGPLEWWKDIILTDETWSGSDGAPDGWRQLDDVSSTTFNRALGLGFIAPCCNNREVLMTDEDGESWELVQLVPDDEEPPKRMSLATGEIDGDQYLLGAGGDSFFGVALDGGPDLDIDGVYSAMESCMASGDLETGKVSQIRFTEGAGNFIWGLEGGLMGMEVTADDGGCYFWGGGDWRTLDVFYDGTLYLYSYWEGAGILPMDGFW